MARTPSNMVPLGFRAPEFKLPDTVSGEERTFEDVMGEKGTVVMFICNHCPFVIHVIDELVDVAKNYQGKGIGFVAISSNDIENYPDDAPEKMTAFAIDRGFTFPYLYDESQEVAKDYDAACTPDIYVFDNSAKCVYRGQLDDSRPGNDAPTDGADLREALEALLEGREIPEDQMPSIGCNIKWKQ